MVESFYGDGAALGTARDGKPWASFPVPADAKTDGDAPATWVRVALFGDAGSTLAPRLTKGHPGLRYHGPGCAVTAVVPAPSLNV